MNYKRLFYNWLQKEKVHHIFFCNVILYSYTIHNFNSGKQLFEYLVKILNKDPETYISSFIWSGTYQGHSFWLEKSLEWNEYLDQWKQTH